MIDGEIPPRPLPRKRRWILAGVFVAVIVTLIVGLVVSSGSSADHHKQPSDLHTSASPSPKITPTVKIPDNATALLSETQARTISGVSSLHWVGSSGVEDRTGRTSSDTRYATSNTYFPGDVAAAGGPPLKYIEVAIYKGHDEYTNMRDQSFDASTGDHDWSFLVTSLKGVKEGFTSVRYAKDGSPITMMGFTFEDVSIKIEVCNLPASDLSRTAKIVVANLEQLDSVDAV